MRRALLSKFLLGFFLIFAPLAWAQKIPARQGHVTDLSQFLSADDEGLLESRLAQARAAGGPDIAVLILPSLGGQEPNAYATAVGNEWGVGEAAKDDGIVFLIETAGEAGRRAVYIAVGAGIEGSLTDLDAARIVQEIVIPTLREGRRADAIHAGLDAMDAIFIGETVFSDAPNPPEYSEAELPFLAIPAFFIGFFHFLMIIAVRRAKKAVRVWPPILFSSLIASLPGIFLGFGMYAAGIPAFDSVAFGLMFGGVPSIFGSAFAINYLQRKGRLDMPKSGGGSGGSGGGSNGGGGSWSSSSSSSSRGGGGGFRGGGGGDSW